MGREIEKILKELDQFVALHENEITGEDDMNHLCEQFLKEHGLDALYSENADPETADDYLDLAEQATSKKKRTEYLRKALELEPDRKSVV